MTDFEAKRMYCSGGGAKIYVTACYLFLLKVT